MDESFFWASCWAEVLPTSFFRVSLTGDEVTALAQLVASESVSRQHCVSGQTNTKFALRHKEQ